MTLMILWEEHRAKHVAGHGYSRFYELYGEWWPPRGQVTHLTWISAMCSGSTAYDEPTVQQVVVQLLHQLGLGADGVKRLQQKSAEQTFRCNRRPSAVGVDLGELAIERDQHLVDDASDEAKGILRRNTVLEVDIREQFAIPLVRSAHPCLPIGKQQRNQIRSATSAALFQRPGRVWPRLTYDCAIADGRNLKVFPATAKAPEAKLRGRLLSFA